MGAPGKGPHGELPPTTRGGAGKAKGSGKAKKGQAEQIAAGHARHQAKIAKLERQIGKARADYEAFKAKHGAAVTASERYARARLIALAERRVDALARALAVERGLALVTRRG